MKVVENGFVYCLVKKSGLSNEIIQQHQLDLNSYIKGKTISRSPASKSRSWVISWENFNVTTTVASSCLEASNPSAAAPVAPNSLVELKVDYSIFRQIAAETNSIDNGDEIPNDDDANDSEIDDENPIGVFEDIVDREAEDNDPVPEFAV